jgi:hypothetical protein
MSTINTIQFSKHNNLVIIIVLLIFNITSLRAQGFGPLTPTLVSPENGSTVGTLFPSLSVSVSDDNSTNLIVKFYGRLVEAGEKFTLIGFPDTQYYSAELNGGTKEIMYGQTQWVVSNKDALNIVYCVGLGDCVEHGDQYVIEWQRFDTAIDYLEDPLTTLLTDGIPYGLAVGNHDQSPNGNPTGTTTFFNQYFGFNRFLDRNYYGGHYGSNNDNHYDLFSASGMDFIAIYFEYDTSPDAAIISWAEGLLQTYSNRRAIIVSHWIVNTGNPGTFGAQGQALYDAFKDNPNVFLMLSGHVLGEGRRIDTFNGNTIHSVLANYQGRAHGGDGWLRIMEFDPGANLINFKTYSTYLNKYEQDVDSQFSLPYNMGNEINTVTVPNNSTANSTWNGLEAGKTYEWYVTVEDDDHNITTGPVWSFTTASSPAPEIVVKAKVLLEGPYIGAGAMTTDLNSLGIIPLNQPYNTGPWNYSGTESVSSIPSNIVDWVLIELRNTYNGSSVGRRAAFLKNDGSIVDLDGSSPVKFSTISDGDYYIVVRHRNHLAVMSATAQSFSTGAITDYDFTTAQSKAYGTNAMKDLLGNATVFGMFGGNGNGDGFITASDKNISWFQQNGSIGYFSGDFNLNTFVTAGDKNLIWFPNNGLISQVP